MAKQHRTQANNDPVARYEIRVHGHLGSQWMDWFDGLAIIPDDNGDTRLVGTVVDQAALHGLLKKVRDIGLPLISVNQLHDDENRI